MPFYQRAKKSMGKRDSVVELSSYEGKYPNTLFNKGVRAKNEDHGGHVMKETNDKIVVFGEGNNRFDIPKSEIYQVGMNVILKIDFPETFKYRVDKNNALLHDSLVFDFTICFCLNRYHFVIQ